MARITDILEEVTKQVSSLKRQASKARRYREMQEELRVRIFRLKRQQLFKELAGTSQIVILLRGEGEEIKRRRIVGIKVYG